MHLETRPIMASECISKLTRSRWAEPVEPNGRQAFINITPHLAWNPTGILDTERFWLEECRMSVREYLGIPGHYDPHKLRGSMKPRQACMRPRAGKDRLCNWYNLMMPIYSGVSHIYNPCCWVHLLFPCVSVSMFIERLRWYMPYYDVVNLVTVTKTNMINKMPCGGCGTLRTTAVRILHQVSRRACAEDSDALEVSDNPALRSQALQKSPTDLRRGLTRSKICLFWKSNLVASWMHLHNCRCFQERLRLLLQSLRAHCKTPGGPGSIWKYIWSTGEGYQSVWEVCVWLPDWFTFC